MSSAYTPATGDDAVLEMSDAGLIALVRQVPDMDAARLAILKAGTRIAGDVPSDAAVEACMGTLRVLARAA